MHSCRGGKAAKLRESVGAQFQGGGLRAAQNARPVDLCEGGYAGHCECVWGGERKEHAALGNKQLMADLADDERLRACWLRSEEMVDSCRGVQGKAGGASLLVQAQRLRVVRDNTLIHAPHSSLLLLLVANSGTKLC